MELKPSEFRTTALYLATPIFIGSIHGDLLNRTKYAQEWKDQGKRIVKNALVVSWVSIFCGAGYFLTKNARLRLVFKNIIMILPFAVVGSFAKEVFSETFFSSLRF